MALTKKSWQDHLTSSFGQIDEGIRSRTGNDGLIVGGVYEASGSVTAVEHGDFAALHTDANQNLMVNVADGEIQAQLGTVKLVESGTLALVKAGTVTAVNNVVSGTLAELGVLNAGSIVVTAGTISDLDTVGTVGVLEAGSVVVTSGTIGDLDTVGTVGVINSGSVVVTVGTVTPFDSVASTLGTVTITTPASAGTLTCPVTGLLRYVTQVSPDLEGTGTVTTCLVDSSGGTLVALAAQNESVTTCYGTISPMTTTMKWVATADGTQSATVGVVLQMHYEK